MKNQIKVFSNSEFGNVRTVEVNGIPYFVGKDVAEILGYKNGSRDINRHVDEEDRGSTEMVSPQRTKQNTTIINESGLYSLILSSKMPSAKKFKRWVTSEVLPQIRQTGSYISQETIKQISDTILSQLLVKIEDRMYGRQDEMAHLYWKQRIGNPLLEEISVKCNIEYQNVYSLVYRLMRSQFGFNKEQSLIDYKIKYFNSSPSIYDAIAESPTYREQFVLVCNIILDKVNKNIKPVVEIKFTTMQDTSDIIETLANQLNDKSAKHCHTYAKIYSQMNTKRGWKSLKTRNSCTTNKDVVDMNFKQKKAFVKIANELLVNI